MKLNLLVSCSSCHSLKEWRVQAQKRLGFARFIKTNEGEQAVDGDGRVLDLWFHPKHREGQQWHSQQPYGNTMPDGSQVIIEAPTHITYVFTTRGT